MNEKIKTLVSMIMVVAIALLLAFPFVPAIASDKETSSTEVSASEAVVALEEKAVSQQEALISEKDIGLSQKETVDEVATGTDNAAATEGLATQLERETATMPVNEEPWEVTSLDISKDVDVVTAPGYEISLEKTASESYMEMMVGETKSIEFTINVGAQLADSYYIAGNIFVQNTGEWPADVIAVSDTVWYKAGGPAWLPATSNITTTVPMGDNAIPTGGPHVYSYEGTFTLPVPLASVTSMSNLIEITISNKPDPPKPGMQDWKYHYRQDFAKPAAEGSSEVSLEDIETITPDSGLSYEIKSVTINGSAAGSLTGPWALDLADAPFTIIIDKDLTAEAAGEYILNNKARIGELTDEVDVEIVVEEEDGRIHGHKYIDLDGDGELDQGEPELEGVTIKLYKYEEVIEVAEASRQASGTILIAETITDENGYFSFTGLEPGLYLVEEVVPEGMYATSENPVMVELGSSEKVCIYFLNAEKARVTGEKLDFNTQEPVAGVKFVLEGDEFYMEVFSGEDGQFDFGWLMPGEYLLYEIVPEGWVAVSETEHQVILENGDEEHFVFVNERLSAIYGYKWIDVNGNGEIDDADARYEGLTVELWKDGALIASTTTDENGYFIFEGLESGQYVVMEKVPEGYYAISAAEVGVILEAGEEKMADFLNAPLGAVLGTKWLDLTANGQADEGEEGLAGVTIRLLDAEGEVIASTVTAADGSYSFTGLEAGEYSVEEIVPDGYVATSPISVSFTLSAGEEMVIDFHNNVQVAGEVVVPVEPAQPEAGQTLPVTGFEMSLLLILIALMILTGTFIASYGVVRIMRTR
ncbi:MAG: carboxypeptidase regulatory-like domain-containing protein [Actinobacteria bacterium]|nr:carboxypeptidase regulatory-like domain-containing protein [Actinomycetota bacterium]